MKTAVEWGAIAGTLDTEYCSFVGGTYRRDGRGAVMPHISPITGGTDYALHLADLALVDEAVAVARRRFEEGQWSRSEPAFRRDILLKLSGLIGEHRDRLALYETQDSGKAISDSFDRDVPGAAATLSWYAGAVDKLYGETAPQRPGVLATVTLQPVGVVGAVIPWNFPIETAMWKIAPALILGNSVVLKPDEKTSRTALLLAELAVEAGLPAGVLNVVLGGADVGQAMGLHAGIDSLAFTGSTEIGRKFLDYASRSNLKLVSLECGGKSANVVFGDSADLDRAAMAAAQGIFYNQGQVCSAHSRILVQKPILESFLEKLCAAARTFSPGAPLDPASVAGSMIGISHRDGVLARIAEARAAGGSVLAGGEVKSVAGYGNYIEPTVIVGLSADAALMREEAFGPVVCVLPFDDEAEAIALANDTLFPLSASVWSGSFSRAHHVAARLHAGTVSVNAVDALDVSVPFGGFRASGFGRDLSLHALRNYAQPKTVWFDYSRS